MAIWYSQNDYCFTHINKIEVNIKALSSSNIVLSIFDHNKPAGNTLVEENTFSSLEEAKERLSTFLHQKINVPDINKLLKLQK